MDNHEKCERYLATSRSFMKEFKGDRLYVNLGASQTRRRLKGYGFGVKKVESAGKNQAVIIHTATGQHLRELERLFADTSPSTATLSPRQQLLNCGSPRFYLAGLPDGQQSCGQTSCPGGISPIAIFAEPATRSRMSSRIMLMN